MRLGIDFGTTRTRVAAAIRGNYPVISFHTEHEDAVDWYPSLIAAQGDHLAFGFRAQAVQYDPGWDLLRSFKRQLSDSHPETLWRVGSVEMPALDWMTRFLTALRQDLARRSNLEAAPGDRLEAMVGIPAHANSNQRFLTLEAFRRAGFDVIGMLNEPSAAGIEYAHRYRKVDLSSRREHVVVYDLGGGTFDAAVICMAGNRHDVVSSEGIPRLGGDDFDAALLELALTDPAVAAQPPPGHPSRLLTLCREAKEGINPNSRKIAVDFGQVDPSLGTVMVPVAGFYEACDPLILRTIRATESALGAALGAEESDPGGLGVVYLVGGSCELPVLARALRERFGKRVRRSPYPSGATAIGLAVAADQNTRYIITEKFSRHFGVWREAEDGHRIVFDPIFTKDTPLPRPGEPSLAVGRRYRPKHNVGRFRFLECSVLGREGEPAGDILNWQEISFPFAPELVGQVRLDQAQIVRDPAVQSHSVEEIYQCDAAGVVQVAITDLTTGHARSFRVRESRPAERDGGVEGKAKGKKS